MTLDNFDEDMVNEYRVKVTVRNNLILTAIEAAGFKNQSAFCREAGMPATALSGMITMKSPPLTSMGEFSDAAKKLMEILCLAPTDLWTSEQLTLKLRHNSAERDVNLDAMRSMLGIHAEEALLLLQPSPEDLAAEKDILPLIEEQLDSLTPREAKVMRLRYGIGCQEHTLEEAGEVLGVTRERVRQIENKAMRKLKHPQRADVLAQLTERYRPDGLQKFNLD